MVNNINRQVPEVHGKKNRMGDIILILVLSISMWWSMYMYDADARYLYPADHLPTAIEQFAEDIADFAADFIYAVKTC